MDPLAEIAALKAERETLKKALLKARIDERIAIHGRIAKISDEIVAWISRPALPAAASAAAPALTVSALVASCYEVVRGFAQHRAPFRALQVMRGVGGFCRRISTEMVQFVVTWSARDTAVRHSALAFLQAEIDQDRIVTVVQPKIANGDDIALLHVRSFSVFKVSPARLASMHASPNADGDVSDGSLRSSASSSHFLSCIPRHR